MNGSNHLVYHTIGLTQEEIDTVEKNGIRGCALIVKALISKLNQHYAPLIYLISSSEGCIAEIPCGQYQLHRVSNQWNFVWPLKEHQQL